MKIVSSLVTVALAAAVFARGIDAQTCSANCGADCVAPSAAIAAGAKFDIPLPSSPLCGAKFTYIKSLTVSEVAGKTITVAFSRGTGKTPAIDTQPTATDMQRQSGVSVGSDYCYYRHTAVAYDKDANDDVKATVTCGATAPATCSIVYKVTYGCTPASTCSKIIGTSPLPSSTAVPKGQSVVISGTVPTPACPTNLKRYIKSLEVSEDAGQGIVVAFTQGTSGSPPPAVSATATAAAKDDADPKGTDDCYLSYVDVGKGVTLTADVAASVTCKDPLIACAVKPAVTYACPITACLTPLTTTDGSTAVQLASGTGTTASVAIKTSETTACPWGLKRFISSLKVTEDAGLGVVVTYAQGTSTTAAAPTGTTTPIKDNGDGLVNCGVTAADVGLDLAKLGTLTDNVVATVKCADNTAGCNIKHKATFDCPSTGITCPTSTTGLTSRPLTTAGDPNGFVVPKTGTCAAGRFSYLKTLDVRGDVVVTFNQGLNPTPAAKGATCAFYKDVMSVKTTPADVVATITCTTGKDCAMSYKAEWDCTPPIVFTRTKVEGKDCVTSLSECANRCAKSYQLVTTFTAATTNPAADAFTTMKFVPQIKATGCTCEDFSAKQGTPTATTVPAENTDAKMSVQITEPTTAVPVSVMTITSTDPDKVCTSTYSRVSFENQYVEKPYTRTTPGTDAKCTPDAATASADDLCAFKCAAEISLTKPVTDSIRVTKAAVTGCNCGDPVDMVVDGDGATAGTDALKYKYAKDTGVLTVTTTTGADDTKLVCDAVYKESCSKVCTDGACGVNDIPTDGLKLKNLDGCPAYTFSYPKSVIVRGLLAENDVSVKSATAVVDKTAVKCYKTYGQLGGTLTAISADFEPTVSCGTGGCKAAVKTEWGCTAPKCPTVTGLSTKVTMTVPNATGMVVPGPATACGTGLKAYIKTLDIRTAAGKDVVVKFNNGLTPSPSSKGTTCTFYSDVIGLTATSTDVTATINCASTTAADTCDVQYKVEYGCYKPAAATVYTRKGAPDGRGCVTDLSTCASRCAKSYQLIATETEKMLLPQITPDGCYCPALTATTDTTTTTKATNTATTMEVNDGTTMTVEYTAPGKECKTTFAKAAFANSFVAETYARGAVTPATCVPAADADAATTCAYKCAAELSIKPLGGDALNVTQAVVTSPADCTCDPFMAYVDVDGLTASGPLKTSSVEIKQTTGALTVKTTTGSTVCTASYAKKTAPPPPATTTPSPTTTAPPPATTAKTGTSAGVSALGAGADAGMVTVTLVAAAAGVQAVGLPA